MIIIYVTACIIVIVATVLLAHFTLRYLYGYRVINNEIQVVLFGKVPLRRVKIKDIEEIKRIPNRELFSSISPEEFFSEQWGNKIKGDILVIRKKKGFSRIITITPDDPDEFIKEVSQLQSRQPKLSS